MNILFITSNRLGDSVLSTGLLDHVIKKNPGARITIVCGALPAPLFREVPGLDRVMVLEKQPLSCHWVSLWFKTVGTSWDMIIDLRASIVSWLLRGHSRRILDTAASRDNTHRLVQLAAVLRLSNVPAPKLWLSDSQRADAIRLMPINKVVLAIGPTANWGGKQWSPKNFSEIIERLTAPNAILEDAHVVVFGAPGERHMARALLDSIPEERCVDLIGAVDLLVAAACLEQADFYIGNDSGLMHLSAAVGTPTLGLFGPSREIHYAPWGEHCAYVRTSKSYEDIRNDPSYDYRQHDSWMGTLSVDSVEEVANMLWARSHYINASSEI